MAIPHSAGSSEIQPLCDKIMNFTFESKKQAKYLLFQSKIRNFAA